MSRLVLAACGAIFIAFGAFLITHPSPQSAPAAVATASVSAAVPSTATPSASATPVPPIPLGYRIQIPRLGIDLPIQEGDIARDTVDLQTPEGWAFHLPGTAIPGSGANSYLYAHARRGMFITLWNAAIGDEIWISTPDGKRLRYVVNEIHPRVPPEEVSWAVMTPPDRLTLQTSTGPNPGDPRFIVVALPG